MLNLCVFFSTLEGNKFLAFVVSKYMVKNAWAFVILQFFSLDFVIFLCLITRDTFSKQVMQNEMIMLFQKRTSLFDFDSFLY